MKNIKIFDNKNFFDRWSTDWLGHLIISNDQIMNSKPVPNIFFDLIESSISDKEILVSLLLCENNEIMFEVNLQLQFTLSLLLDDEVTISWTDIHCILILNKLTIFSRDMKQWRMKLISTEGKLLEL